jgi:hypothetical protein
MFINISNHPMNMWGESQMNAARILGKGQEAEIPFPYVGPNANTEDVYRLAREVVKKVLEISKDAESSTVFCMVQGEQSLAFNIILALIGCGVNVVVATTERVSVQNEISGEMVKSSVFRFVQFRSVI